MIILFKLFVGIILFSFIIDVFEKILTKLNVTDEYTPSIKKVGELLRGVK